VLILRLDAAEQLDDDGPRTNLIADQGGGEADLAVEPCGYVVLPAEQRAVIVIAPVGADSPEPLRPGS
jgi:hypothetical protein